MQSNPSSPLVQAVAPRGVDVGGLLGKVGRGLTCGGKKVSTVALWWNGETPWFLGGWRGASVGTAVGCSFMYIGGGEFYSSKMLILSRFDRASLPIAGYQLAAR